MYSTTKLRRQVTIGLVCLLVLINISSVQSQRAETKTPSLESSPTSSFSNSSSSPSSTCKVCGSPPPCPSCPSGQICVLGLQTCDTCPIPECRGQELVPSIPIPQSSNTGKNGSSTIVPAVIGGIFGIGVLIATGFGYIVYKRRRNELLYSTNNEKLDKCRSSVDSENVIPIAYIPPDTPTTPRPEPAYSRTRASYLTVGTTPLASPLPRTCSDEPLIGLTDDDDIFSEIGTVLQATKATTSTCTGVTVVTATRAKPALVRLNTVKSNTLSTYSGTNQSTPKTPLTANSLLSVHSSNKSSLPGSPTSFHSIGISDEEGMLLPRIDIERSSLDSSNNATGTGITSSLNQTDASQNLISPFLDPMEGRQSFGLFGSDEVDSSSSQVERTSLMSSLSSNQRSTMMSDDGDGEIMIFWGGSAPTLLSNDRNSTNEKGLTIHKIDESKKTDDKTSIKTESDV